MPATHFHDDTLRRDRLRALKFMDYIGGTPEVFSAMQDGGFRREDLTEGRTLFHQTALFLGPAAIVQNAKAAEARASIDRWDEPNLRRYRAAVARFHPLAEPRLFKGIKAGTGAQSILTVALFLDRVEAMEEGRDRAVITTLEKRGLTKSVRADLRKLLALATKIESSEPVEETLAAHRENLLALKVWFDDWAETARTSRLNRFHLIHLGLAKRRTTPAE